MDESVDIGGGAGRRARESVRSENPLTRGSHAVSDLRAPATAKIAGLTASSSLVVDRREPVEVAG